ncbi:MAG: S41 family peptidase [Acidobacteriota bacterium]
MTPLARIVTVTIALGTASVALAAHGYYRFPALFRDTLVFTAEGDLWRVPITGGVAQRLTTHPAEESQAAISPDGSRVAFVAAYDSGNEVYVMPLAGGAPKRLTFDATRCWVQGFTRSGEVVYATENVIGPTWRRVLRIVNPDSGQTHDLPLADANEAAFDDTGSTVWFTRFGLHVTGDNARDYRGGAMAQIWRWNIGSNDEAQRVAPDLAANLKRPMWWKGRIYAVSDAAGSDNLWSMAADGTDRQQLTHHRGWDVKGATLDDGRIAYQLGADLHLFDIATSTDRIVPIELASDFDQERERYLRSPLDYFTSANFALMGDRVAISARGSVALVGTGALRRVDITGPHAARVRDAVLTHDGKSVLAITDLEGLSQIWRYPADGSPGAEALTAESATRLWRLFPSPDGRLVAYSDTNRDLWLLDLRDRSTRRIEHADYAGDDPYGDVVWSPDSRYVALSRPDSLRLRSQLVLYEVAGGRHAVLTTDRYESAAPAFSRDGKWLYFLSDRTFVSTVPGPWGDRNTGAFFDRRTRIYALALQPGTRFPFLPINELVGETPAPTTVDAPQSAAKRDVARAPKDKPKVAPSGSETARLPEIAFDGLAERLFEVPVAAGNYSNLAVDADRLYWLERETALATKLQLKSLAINANNPEPELFAADVQAFSLSADARKLYFMKFSGKGAGDMFIVDVGAKAPPDLSKAAVRVGDWVLPIDPKEEWQQMFDDAWRMHRQFAFDRSMRGQDWDAVRRQYQPLVARLTDRRELDDLLGQMISEFGTLHSQVRGGELRAEDESAVAATLGAVLQPAEDGVRIAHVYRTEPERPSERGPLQQPGVDARENDLLLAINGQPVRTPGEVASRLQNQAGQQVLLTLRRGQAAPHRTVVVPVPIDRDSTLRYGDWVQSTREAVGRASGGRIGYLHLRAMGSGDMATFVREFYANIDREGLIIDVRRNRGGSIDSWVIEKLLRRTWAYWQPPGSPPYWNMQQSFRGHLAVLADQLTYSDGETFSAGIEALELGPVIGMRTAGAGVWLSDRNRLTDNGIARVAEFGQFDREGRWIVEGHGVSPTIEVDNLPLATYRGSDAQLDAALAYLNSRAAKQPLTDPRAQPIPPRGHPAR